MLESNQDDPTVLQVIHVYHYRDSSKLPANRYPYCASLCHKNAIWRSEESQIVMQSSASASKWVSDTKLAKTSFGTSFKFTTISNDASAMGAASICGAMTPDRPGEGSRANTRDSKTAYSKSSSASCPLRNFGGFLRNFRHYAVVQFLECLRNLIA